MAKAPLLLRRLPLLRLHPTTTIPLQTPQRRSISAYGYEQAKALVFSTHGDPSSVLSLHAHSLSPAHSRLATVRMLAAPINPADINALQGTYPSQPTFNTALGTREPSAVPGNEGVGEVLAAGEKASLRKGDWVVMRHPAQGTWRTHIQADADAFLKLEDADRQGIGAVQAGTVSVNPCTAWAMLEGYVGGGIMQGEGVREGEWVIQNGSNSGVGRAVIQLAKAKGVKSLNVIRARPEGDAATEEMKEDLRGLGADVVVTEDEATAKDFPTRVKEWTGGGQEKLPLALNCVGGRSALNLAKVLSPGGWHLTYGAMAKQPVNIPGGMLIFKDLRFAGFWVSAWSDKYPEEKLKAIREVFQLTRDGKFKDSPMEEVKWDMNTEEDTLKSAVQGTLDGYRSGKGVFVFGET